MSTKSGSYKIQTSFSMELNRILKPPYFVTIGFQRLHILTPQDFVADFLSGFSASAFCASGFCKRLVGAHRFIKNCLFYKISEEPCVKISYFNTF